ncbi:maspardin isoform X1 [Parasteatoda tepidariorum]|uniref:maspardin isoform X1 n=1 Tax=Parasteatoda tepidariorum TaxID=114398 RepID=UPI000A2BFD06|nr:maspardin isoform X1 [Parasteatoda tepidariorum]XP_042910676.1 maspardin isoform X2 [Parasteatoda tepidariorum]XP_042910677.1 maspardin isoform X1 [Parasteatoda tepidariorum]
MEFIDSKLSTISNSAEYISFRSRVPQKKIIVDEDSNKVWTIYDFGPRSITCPLICLPPVSGTADIFFNQIISLCAKGYRVIAVQYPVYWTMNEFTNGFSKLLDHLGLDKVHLFGASLGGFLAQKFAEATFHTHTVHSIILCNSFTDTSIFNFTDTAVVFWMFPAVVLKRMVMGNFSKGYVDASIADSIDFMVEKLETLSQQELASRLTLTCMNCYVEPQKLRSIPITIVDVFDDSALSIAAREEMYKFYPDAKRAHLKKGGNFPYLSCSEEVNLHIQIHLRPFEGTKVSACEGASVCNEAIDSLEDL